MPGYTKFAECILVRLNNGKELYLMQIERVNPLIANELQTLGLTMASTKASI